MFFFALFSCSVGNKVSPEDENPGGTWTTSYVKFTISGPVDNGNFEYKDIAGNDFKTSAIGSYKDQTREEMTGFNLSIYNDKGKQFDLSAPPERGTYTNIPFYAGSKYCYISFYLDAANGIVYQGNDVTVEISELTFNDPYLGKIKGTFSGSFGIMDKGNNPGDHFIEGEFELK